MQNTVSIPRPLPVVYFEVPFDSERSPNAEFRTKKKTASFYSHIESHHISVHTIPGNHFPFGRALLFDRVILTFKKLMANSPTLSKDCCKMRCISITKNYNKKQSAHYSLHTGTQPYNCNVAGNEAGVVLS